MRPVSSAPSGGHDTAICVGFDRRAILHPEGGLVDLCVPLSDVFRRNEEKLLPLVRAVSFKGPSDETYPGKSRFLECSIGIADPLFADRLEKTGLLAALQSGRFVSFACDIGPAYPQVDVASSPNGFPRYLPASAPMDEATYLSFSQRNVAFLRRHFRGVVKVENLNYFPTGAYELVCEPEFIMRFVRALDDVELLLDTAHATVSAANFGISVDTYLAGLPLDTLSEVHLSGSRRIDGVWEDAHDLPADSDLAVLERIIRRVPVQWITVEYYRDERLVDAYQRLARMRLNFTPRDAS